MTKSQRNVGSLSYSNYSEPCKLSQNMLIYKHI